MGNVVVDGRRLLIEPPELGNCQDPDCRTLSAPMAHNRADEYGRGVLLVASYTGLSSYFADDTRVCAACDERRLRAWLT